MLRPAAAALTAAMLIGSGVAHADRDVLWNIVDQQCVPDQVNNRDAAPCTEVEVSDGVPNGYAVLRDHRGPHQFLLIPTARVTGLEDPGLLNPLAPNYFAAAWRARAYTEAAAGGALPRNRIALAVNSAAARTQDQLHIHIDCLRHDVGAALDSVSAAIGPSWSPLPVDLAGDRYQARRFDSLDTNNPVHLSADGDLAHTSIAVVGAGPDEDSGFILVRQFIGDGEFGGGEELQDHAHCPAPLPPGPQTAK